jgi:hypothetical protein
MTKLKLPQLSAVAGILLKDTAGNELAAHKLWADKPTLVFCLRRPGCGEHRICLVGRAAL